jgi:hypothetical protein
MLTLHSERLNAELHLGKLPANPFSGVHYATDIRPALVKAGKSARLK